MDMKRFFLYAIAIAALALAGCGGNGGTGMAGGGATATVEACETPPTKLVAKPSCMDPALYGSATA